VPTGIHALRTLGRTTERDIGVKLNLEELLVPVSDLPALPVSAYGQPVDSGRGRAPAARRLQSAQRWRVSPKR
jgi:hypothetical protein